MEVQRSITFGVVTGAYRPPKDGTVVDRVRGRLSRMSSLSTRVFATGLILIGLGILAIVVSVVRLSWTEGLGGLGFIAGGAIVVRLSL